MPREVKPYFVDSIITEAEEPLKEEEDDSSDEETPDKE